MFPEDTKVTLVEQKEFFSISNPETDYVYLFFVKHRRKGNFPLQIIKCM